MQLEKLKRIAKNLNRNHELAILISFLLGLGLVSAVFILGASLGLLSSFAAVLALFFIVSRAWSGIVAGASYIGRAIDFITDEKTLVHAISAREQHKHQANSFGIYEQVGYFIGLLACTAICIWLIVSGFSVPLLIPLGPVIANSIFYVVSAGIFTGLFSRIGRLFDCFYKAKNWDEVYHIFNHNYELALIITLLAGIGISLSVLTTVGASAIFPGLNPFLASVFFTISLTGALVSGASYIGRALDFLGKEQTILHLAANNKNRSGSAEETPKLEPYLRPGRYENTANIIGLVIALGLCTALLLTGFEIPFLTALGGLAYPVLYITCIGIFAGMFSRIGRTLDRAFQPRIPQSTSSDSAKVDNEACNADKGQGARSSYPQLFINNSKLTELTDADASVLYEKTHSWKKEQKACSKKSTSFLPCSIS